LRRIVLGELDEVPALRMIRMTADEIKLRAEALARRLGRKVTVREGQSVIGGGATPEQSLPTWLIVVAEGGDAVGTERRLRANDPPIIARIEDERVVLDLRTVLPEEEELLIQVLR
jgi:L-seryl-tRNA(Ser) seleniumtransferase